MNTFPVLLRQENSTKVSQRKRNCVKMEGEWILKEIHTKFFLRDILYRPTQLLEISTPLVEEITITGVPSFSLYCVAGSRFCIGSTSEGFLSFKTNLDDSERFCLLRDASNSFLTKEDKLLFEPVLDKVFSFCSFREIYLSFNGDIPMEEKIQEAEVLIKSYNLLYADSCGTEILRLGS